MLSSAAGEKTCGTSRLRIALVRHGESQNNIHEAKSWDDYTKYRKPDPDLSERGFEQAALLGSYLGDASASASLGIHPIDELWVSPVKRTLQTMAPTAAALGLSPRVHTRVFEAGGIYEGDDSYTTFKAHRGLTRSQMSEMFPTYTLPDDVEEDGWFVDVEGTGKETTAGCRKRAAGVAAELRDAARALDAPKNVVLVAHYDFLCALLDALILGDGAPTDAGFENWRHFNTGVTVIDIEADGGVAVLMANAVGHLLKDRTGRDDLVSGFPIG